MCLDLKGLCPSARPHPVTVEELDGSEDVELASHEELDGQFPGQRRHSMLTGPLVDFLQKLPGSLKQTHMRSVSLTHTHTHSHNGRVKQAGSETGLLNLIHPPGEVSPSASQNL